MTRFWIGIVRRFLARDPCAPLLERVNGVVDTYGDRKKLFLDYYSEDRIMSSRARRVWLAPDLKPLGD